MAAIVSARAVLGMSAMKHEAAADRKFRNAVRIAQGHLQPSLPAGLFVTDPERTPDLLETIEALPDGIGVLFRHFGRPDQLKLAPQLGKLCRAQFRQLIVSADPLLAIRIGAGGVHWPARLTLAATKVLRSQKLGIQTMSVHSVEELRRARCLGMDAILVSAIFRSDSPSAGTPIGLSRFASFGRNAGMAVYALGGVTSENAERVSKLSGFASVSGLGEVYRPEA